MKASNWLRSLQEYQLKIWSILHHLCLNGRQSYALTALTAMTARPTTTRGLSATTHCNNYNNERHKCSNNGNSKHPQWQLHVLQQQHILKATKTKCELMLNTSEWTDGRTYGQTDKRTALPVQLLWLLHCQGVNVTAAESATIRFVVVVALATFNNEWVCESERVDKLNQTSCLYYKPCCNYQHYYNYNYYWC